MRGIAASAGSTYDGIVVFRPPVPRVALYHDVVLAPNEEASFKLVTQRGFDPFRRAVVEGTASFPAPATSGGLLRSLRSRWTNPSGSSSARGWPLRDCWSCATRSTPAGPRPALSLFGLGWALAEHAGVREWMPLDPSIVFDGGWRLLSGQLPYRDFGTPRGWVPIALKAFFFVVTACAVGVCATGCFGVRSPSSSEPATAGWRVRPRGEGQTTPMAACSAAASVRSTRSAIDSTLLM